MRFLKPVASLLLLANTAACFHELPPIPTKGYGEPYKSTGKPIYVHDARGGWEVSEGGKPITSEQALEATKDPEYEIRRQEAKKYNEEIYAEGESHRTRGKILLASGTVLAIGAHARRLRRSPLEVEEGHARVAGAHARSGRRRGRHEEGQTVVVHAQSQDSRGLKSNPIDITFTLN